jgi:hypothetical protein
LRAVAAALDMTVVQAVVLVVIVLAQELQAAAHLLNQKRLLCLVRLIR